ncbi:MAG: efflux RND transporter permease subunit, partial [Bdellovibrionales bacterium]|nr:efflux RND transporter permease subunit [Bdellovibrionales bacterium]
IDRDIDFALQEVQTLIGRAQRFLPGVVEPPTVTKSNADDRPIMYLSLKTKSLSMRELMILFRDRIRDRLSTVDGVAEVRAFGFHEPMMRIDLLNQKLKKYDLTALDVLESVNRGHLELAAGKFDKGDHESLARFIGEATETNQFKNLPITRRGGGPNYIPIKIEDVAEVYEGIENLKRISRADKVFALGIAIVKQRGVNAVETADSVIEKLEVINKVLPEGTDISVNFNGTQFIKDSVNELLFTIILSALLTSLVCWLFLKTFSATINILLAIPTAVIGTFAFMNLFGFTLNTFSLLGITLAIGIVVDDAIVMLENIVRHREMGKQKIQAAFVGSKEITFAVIATTLALIAIFAPITLMPGIEGKFFFEFAVTLCIAVSLSSLEALTLTPMRCSQFLALKEKGLFIHQWVDKIIIKTRNYYQKTLQWSLDHKLVVLFISFALFLSSLLLIRSLPKEFSPAQDRNVLFLIFMAPDGKSMEYTDRKVKEFEEFATLQEGVQRVYVAVGGFGSGGQGNRGNGVVILKSKDQRKLDQFEIAQQLREKSKSIEGIKIIIRDSFGSAIGGRRGSPIEFTIKGPSTQIQKNIYEQLKTKMEDTGKIVGIRSDDVNDLPEIHILPKRQEAQKRGVDISQISNLVNITLAGATPGQYTSGGRRFDIFIQLKEEQRENPQQINSLFIRNNRGELINLKEVVEFLPTKGPQNIFREDRERGVRVDANLEKGVILGDALKEIRNIIKGIDLRGHNIEFSQNLE